MQESYFSLSQAYDRLAQLKSKQEYQQLDESESEEMDAIQEMIQENSDSDFLDY
jgi:hypothetical protein